MDQHSEKRRQEARAPAGAEQISKRSHGDCDRWAEVIASGKGACKKNNGRCNGECRCTCSG